MKNKNYIKVIGNKYINGIIKVSGSKNASLPIICASLLCMEKVILNNVPNILDVQNMLNILNYLNVEYAYKDNQLIIDPTSMVYKNLNIDLMETFRAAYYFIPILLNEKQELEFTSVGGCNFENRPIDIHLDLLKEVGCQIYMEEKKYILKLSKFKSLEYTFKNKTVGGTINAILLGVKSKKKTIIKNYSKEPEVIDVISFLIQCGLDVEMTDETLCFQQKTPLKGVNYTIMNDRIEAETFALLGLALGKIGIFGFNKNHHDAFLSFLDENKFLYTLEDDFLLLNKEVITKSNDISLNTYPCLSTDIGPILLSYLLLGSKLFLIRDSVYKTRLSKLRFFESSFSFQNDTLLVNPLKVNLDNKVFYGNNLRDTMAYLFYCLTHEGTFYLYGIEHIKRGYENIIDKLVSLNCIVEECYE